MAMLDWWKMGSANVMVETGLALATTTESGSWMLKFMFGPEAKAVWTWAGDGKHSLWRDLNMYLITSSSGCRNQIDCLLMRRYDLKLVTDIQFLWNQLLLELAFHHGPPIRHSRPKGIPNYWNEVNQMVALTLVQSLWLPVHYWPIDQIGQTRPSSGICHPWEDKAREMDHWVWWWNRRSEEERGGIKMIPVLQWWISPVSGHKLGITGCFHLHLLM